MLAALLSESTVPASPAHQRRRGPGVERRRLLRRLNGDYDRLRHGRGPCRPGASSSKCAHDLQALTGLFIRRVGLCAELILHPRREKCKPVQARTSSTFLKRAAEHPASLASSYRAVCRSSHPWPGHAGNAACSVQLLVASGSALMRSSANILSMITEHLHGPVHQILLVMALPRAIIACVPGMWRHLSPLASVSPPTPRASRLEQESRDASNRRCIALISYPALALTITMALNWIRWRQVNMVEDRRGTMGLLCKPLNGFEIKSARKRCRPDPFGFQL